MASKQSEEPKTLYRGWVAAMQAEPEMPLEELRRRFEHLGDVTGEPGGVDYIETDAGGVPAMWAIPKGCERTRVLLCAHGGGYVICSMYTHRKLYAHVAKTVGCRALIVDYRRAPENIHPGPVDDMREAVASRAPVAFSLSSPPVMRSEGIDDEDRRATRLVRYGPLSAQVGGAERPCQAQRGCVRRCGRRYILPTDGEGDFRRAPRRGR
jgi:hypothetical protein